MPVCLPSLSAKSEEYLLYNQINAKFNSWLCHPLAVTSGSLFNLPGPSFYHLENGDASTTPWCYSENYWSAEHGEAAIEVLGPLFFSLTDDKNTQAE